MGGGNKFFIDQNDMWEQNDCNYCCWKFELFSLNRNMQITMLLCFSSYLEYIAQLEPL